MKSTYLIYFLLAFLTIIKPCLSYVQTQLRTKRNQNKIFYCIHMQIQHYNYCLAVTFNNTQQYIISPTAKHLALTNQNPSHSTKIIKQLNPQKQIIGQIFVTNIQNWRQDNWKGYIKQALLLFEGRFDFKISLYFNKSKQLISNQLDKQYDSILSFSPNYNTNKMYNLLRNSTQYIKNDIISIYRGKDDDDVRIQLGGFQHLYSKINNNNIRYHQIDLIVQDSKWKIPIEGITCFTKNKQQKENNQNNKYFNIPNSKMNMTINIQSPILKLPNTIAFDIQRAFQSHAITCKTLPQSQFFSCQNYTKSTNSHYIQLKLSQSSTLNISLSHLIRSYNKTTKQTIFNIQFINKSLQIQLSQILLKYLYITIDLKQHKLQYSQINYQIGINIIKYLIIFGVFIVIGVIVIAIGLFLMLRKPKGYKKLDMWMK